MGRLLACAQGAGGTLKTYIHSHFFSQPSSVPPPPPVPSKFSNFSCFDWKNISFWDVSPDFRGTNGQKLITYDDASWVCNFYNSRLSAQYLLRFSPAPTVKLNKQYKN